MTNGQPSTKKISVEKLEFDRHNPRLVSQELNLQKASDETVLAALVSEADIGELVSSIVSNTYLDIEPVIVTKQGVLREGNYRVLEGNRRLSAIRFIQNPALARRCKLSMPTDISQEVLDSIKEITVYEVDDENEARAFIGFKHINGAHRWGAYAKAKFIVDWYLKEQESEITIDDIARQLGDNNQMIRSLIGGMLVLTQAENLGLFETSDRSKSGAFGFSHLYTALGRIEYREFLGLEKNWSHSPSENPVAPSHYKNLKEVLTYIYGSKKDEQESLIKSQNPDLKHLGEVLANPVSLSVIRATGDFSLAREEIGPAENIFQDALIIAHQKVQDALKRVSKFSPEQHRNLVKYTQEMLDNVEVIKLTMDRKIAKEQGNADSKNE